MEYKVELKNVAPTRVLKTKETVAYTEIEQKTVTLLELATENVDGSLIVLNHQPEFRTQSQVTCCLPIKRTHFPVDESLYTFDVLQRVKAVSTMHRGDYENLEEAFSPLLQYIESNNLKTMLPCRIIFHKREKKHSFFKRSSKNYLTEIQIPIEE